MRRQDVLLQWRERWALPEAQASARQVISELMAGDVRTASPFGEVDGRADLRGLPVTTAGTSGEAAHERVSVRGGSWDGLDLTGASLAAMNWTGLRVSDCVFDDADLDQLRCWAVQVSDCSARRVSLRSGQIGSVMGGHARSTWTGINFHGADVRRLHGDVNLIDVDFSNATFSRTDLGWSNLTRLRFSGRVNGLTLGSLPVADRPTTWVVDDVNFRDADPRDLTLIGIDLGTPDAGIHLPDDDGHWVVTDWPNFLDRVAASPPHAISDDVEIWVSTQRRRLGPHQQWGFVSVADAVAFAGEAFSNRLLDCR